MFLLLLRSSANRLSAAALVAKQSILHERKLLMSQEKLSAVAEDTSVKYLAVPDNGFLVNYYDV